jgi:hypothetical protein
VAAGHEQPTDADRESVLAMLRKHGEAAAARHLKISGHEMVRIAATLPVRADVLAGARARLAEPVVKPAPKATQLGLFSAPVAPAPGQGKAA